MKVYFANGLFSEADRLYNSLTVSKIRLDFFEAGLDIDIYLPQENEAINDKNAYADSLMIAKADSDKLLESDILISVVDGVEIDSGVAAEIGLFASTDRPIFALFTDVRQHGRNNAGKLKALVNDPTENQFVYRNLFVMGLIKQNGTVFSNTDELISALLEVANNA